MKKLIILSLFICGAMGAGAQISFPSADQICLGTKGDTGLYHAAPGSLQPGWCGIPNSTSQANGAFVMVIPNASTTGTTTNTLTKLTGAPSTAVIASTTDNKNGTIMGITVGGAGTTGIAAITFAGFANCVFDGATTAGDFVTVSTTVAGNCHDIGAAQPFDSSQIIGRVTTNNAAAGTYGVLLNPQTANSPSPGGGGGGPVTTLAFGTIQMPVTNLRVVSTANVIGLAAGDVDLYTVPAGKKAIPVDIIRTNPTGSGVTISSFVEFKSGGVYTKYDLINASGDGAGTIGAISALAPMLLNAGESFSINTNNAGLSVWPLILEFDSSAPIQVARLTSLNAGDNTVLTAGSNGIIPIPNLTNIAAGSPMRGALWYFNNTGVGRTIGWNLVPSGGSPANANQIRSGTILTSPIISFTNYMGGAKTGDFFSINTDANTAGQVAWIVYQYLP